MLHMAASIGSHTPNPLQSIIQLWKMEVDERLLGALEEMGFSRALAEKAIYSGNSTIEAAVNWLADHEYDTSAAAHEKQMTQTQEVNIYIGGSNSFHASEQVMLKAHELRNEARKRRADQEEKLEREREKERIRAGKELMEARRAMEESERKRYLDQRKAEKEEERRARERIRQKLLQDKLERRGMHGLPTEEPVPVKTDMVFPKSPKVDRANPYTVRDRMGECLRSIKLQNKNKDAKAARSFQTLLIYVRNIINSPDERKFRKIRLSNPTFQERVGIYERGIEFLELCGFQRVEGDKFLVLPDEKLDMSTLKLAWTELQNALTNPFFGLFSA
ncbi:uncharacterized protein LOC127239198 isoform X2 [Andrographis paniculata]|uniref:uncharacterized protein LOC127239198 isoform X2 n=1 Tax=Andrographis paniculata TaxID=175694 RepID=UPI0021E7DD46|nr:uncharacterized protein LOC127239198 isoform X2 [Andrographis paniculata]